MMIIAGVSHTLQDHLAELSALEIALVTAVCTLAAVIIRFYLNKISSSEEAITHLTSSRVSKTDFQEFRREVLEVLHSMETKVDNRLMDLTSRQADLSADVTVIGRTVQNLGKGNACGYEEP